MIEISWKNSDSLKAKLENDTLHFEAEGCTPFLSLVQKFQGLSLVQAKKEIEKLGQQHFDLLIKEAILKLANEWDYPYKEEELCHCRLIPTATVDAAIVGGLHEADSIGKYCSAGITCGNCRVDIEAILEFRLGKV